MEIKFCFSCGKEVPEDSSFCPNCGIHISASVHERQPKKETSSTSDTSGGFLLALVITGILLFFIWVLHPVGSFIIVVITALWVYVDAKNSGAGKGFNKEQWSTETWSPLSWSLLVLFLWIVGMPLYLIKRSTFIERN